MTADTAFNVGAQVESGKLFKSAECGSFFSEGFPNRASF
jgi:hypothetical protein